MNFARPGSCAADPQFRERFDREARTISQLDHPHICALYDVGEQDGTSYLVMLQHHADEVGHGSTGLFWPTIQVPLF